MGLSQALSAALAGVTATQQALSVISGNVANANTAGYVDESVSQVALSRSASRASASTRPVSTATSTRCCKASYGRKRLAGPTRTRRRSSISSSNKFTERPGRQARSARPTATSPPRCRRSRAARVRIPRKPRWSAQRSRYADPQLDEWTIQQLRTQAEQGISADVQTANNAIARLRRSISNWERRRKTAQPPRWKTSAIRTSRSCRR